jgi:catechol 2,3-dioxygenase-like lactoylglutathione lyase family enzyme/predicted enzyme related to lactoylglutathione lyase
MRGAYDGNVLASAPTRPFERRLIWEDCMKALIAGLLFASTLVATSAGAQPFPFNDVGVTMGHWHLASKDVEANKKIFVGMGGKWFKIGMNEYVMFPGVFVHLNLGTGPGTGGSQGSVVNHVGFIVNNVQEQVAKWKAAGIAVLPGGNNRLDQAYVETPDGLRMEILEDKTQSMPIRHEHVHLFLQEGEIPKAQAWYAKTFGGKAGTRNNAPVVDVPGAQIRFAKADQPQARTLGRVLDHIGFDVKDLKTFITKIEGEGIKLDEPYRETPTGNAITYITDAWGTRIELIKRGPIPAL